MRVPPLFFGNYILVGTIIGITSLLSNPHPSELASSFSSPYPLRGRGTLDNIMD